LFVGGVGGGGGGEGHEADKVRVHCAKAV